VARVPSEKIGDDLADDGAELVAMAREATRDHDPVVLWMPIDDEMLVRRQRVHAGFSGTKLTRRAGEPFVESSLDRRNIRRVYLAIEQCRSGQPAVAVERGLHTVAQVGKAVERLRKSRALENEHGKAAPGEALRLRREPNLDVPLHRQRQVQIPREFREPGPGAEHQLLRFHDLTAGEFYACRPVVGSLPAGGPHAAPQFGTVRASGFLVRGDAAPGKNNARVRFEKAGLAGQHASLRKSLCGLLPREFVDPYAVPFDAPAYSAEHRAAGGADHQTTDEVEQCSTGFAFEIPPQLVRSQEQRHVRRALEICFADNARSPGRSPQFVSELELLEPEHALTAFCHLGRYGAAHPTETEHDDVVSGHYDFLHFTSGTAKTRQTRCTSVSIRVAASDDPHAAGRAARSSEKASMERRHFLFGSLAATAGCTSISAVHGGGNRFTISGTLRFCDGEDIAGLNLHIVPQVSVQLLSQLTGAYLIRFDDRSRPYPDLLERIPSLANGDISPDGLSITYRLRRGLAWDDGHPLRSDDIVFSFEAVNNPKNNEYSRTGFDLIADVAARDPYAATIKLKRPYGSFYEIYFSSSNTPLLPKHLLGGLPDINTAPYNALPVGAGPFKYTKWKRNESVEMVANDGFYRGRPKLDRVVYKIVPDWNTVEALLRTGELDLAWLVPSNIVDRLATIPGFTRVGQPSDLRVQLQFNTASQPLQELVVRQALRLATDRATLLKKVEHDHGYLSDSVLGPLVAEAVSIPPEPYDPKRAAAMLEAAGWIAGADGVRAKNGVRLVIDIDTITGNPERDTWAVLIQSWWAEIGVKTSVKHYPPSVLFGAYSAGGIFTRGLYTASIDEQGYGYSGGSNSTILACNQFPPAGFNVVRLCNPKLDALMERFEGSYDPVVRKTTLVAIQALVESESPMVTLFFPQDNFVYNSDVRNVGSFANLDDAYRWSM
jgi:peptide/nickel transport system substrate-binding protein